MGKVLPDYLSNWTTEKVRRGKRVNTKWYSRLSNAKTWFEFILSWKGYVNEI